jgi:phage tail sheath protein FI
MPIVQSGSVNNTALIVPDLYVEIVPPQNLLLNGVPTNVVGVVGTASWGPVNQPTLIGSYAAYASTFGPVMARLYDMGTHVATAVQQGASNFRGVRVTDGTDVAATVSIGTSPVNITFTAKYTGNQKPTVTFYPGAGSSWNVAIVLPGIGQELFQNVPSGGGGNAVWVNIANAINNGLSAARGPSNLIVASAGSGVAGPVAATAYQLVGGTDGASVATSAMVGVDTIPRKGMYCLRGQGCSIGVLADGTDSTQWTTIDGFGLSEGIYMMQCGPSGDTIANAVTTMTTAGLSSYASKLLFGDWIWWNDQANQVVRLVSPQGFAAGRLANLSPEQSGLNKPMYGVAGSQKSGTPGANLVSSYAAADLQTLFQAGIDVISNPQPGGAYWGLRLGHNTSANPAQNGDNYTRLTNYLAATLAAGMGVYVGQVINATLFNRIKATLLSFLQNLLGQGILGSTTGALPFQVVCDITNNPPARTALNYVQADVQVQYQGINEKFIVNLEGGQTVLVTVPTPPTGAIPT